MKAQKKPVIIDYLPHTYHLNEFKKWVESFGDDFAHWFSLDGNELIFNTLFPVTEDYVIIRNPDGSYYLLNKSIFYKTYDIL